MRRKKKIICMAYRCKKYSLSYSYYCTFHLKKAIKEITGEWK